MEKDLSDAVEAEGLGGDGVDYSNHKALKVPLDALESYLERVRPGRLCGFCSAGVYQAAPSPSGGTAGVVATPVPNVAKVGAWFFVATCSMCGDTRFFHAGRTMTAMASDQ